VFTSNKTDQPVLRDTAAAGAWKASGFTAREQWLVFDKKGKVHSYFKPYNAPKLNLLTSTGMTKMSALLKSLQ